MVKVKICGITNLEDAKYAIESGTDALGFLADIPPCPKNKKISLHKTKEILSKIPKRIWTFILSTSTNPKHIVDICKKVNPTHVQIIEKISAKEISEIKKHLPNTKIVKVISVQNENALSEAKEYEEVADFILLDSRVESQCGGTGKTHNWDISSKIVKESSKPVFLAGGLNSENIKKAISKVKPYGVDADTLLEKSPGKKDFEKVREFIRIVKEL